MASPNKQQKRAKRAKDKAKQIRMSGRKSIPMYGDPAHATAQPPVYVLEPVSYTHLTLPTIYSV